MDLDDARRAALRRLTENERECLRRRLRHQTAKQMAIDLGVSPHAVEKRLKMARTKLGLSSSLEAARLLDAVERCGPSIPQAPDLVVAPAIRQTSGLVIGVSVMIVAAALAFAIFSAHPPTAARQTAAAERRTAPVGFRPASPAGVRAFVSASFRAADRDGSGFIEQREAPARTGIGRPYLPGHRPARDDVTWIGGRPAQAMWIARADVDGDGRVSEAEYMAATYPLFAARGVPANWRPRER